ncbi:flavin-containing monooxygenase [Nocardioides iriomotensis]|uniref:FAD-dependent oxidoreductase n=1 Tax=Nocardioides iriomotensis TaxID=715784 RepID=A0A4Q5IV87_9ACTN|nr:FAD-dependent oxidoreductase [Nocardioides iriomotensis]RYU08829.1 FAD-dependent oxidoreductase [Nocardioides iriomotensis]
MTSQHIETLVVGAGQAGLATAYHLQRRGRPVLVVDGNERVGDNWRCHWDSLRLYSPARYDGLPGLPFPGPAWHCPGKDEVADYLEQYALHHQLPVRMSTRVDRLAARPGGGFVASVGPDTITCDNVVVATGTFGRTPYVPAFAADLDPSVRQLHSSEYRRPGDLPDGRVLVVGASHSGTEIAHELAPTHETVLVGRDCGKLPFRIDSPHVSHLMVPIVFFVFRHVLTRRTPMGRKEMPEVRAHGGPSLRVMPDDLARDGVERRTVRVVGTRGGLPLLDDGTVVDASTVIWCTGFRQRFSWIDLPVIDPDGWPQEYRGVVEAAPGLYFCGLSYQFAFSSMLVMGIGRDAEHVARRIAEGARRATPVAA